MEARGYATVVAPDAPTWERDTLTCRHCQSVVFVKPGSAQTVYLFPREDGGWREEMGAFCRVCMSAICLTCLDHGRCVPWERRLERAEARDRLRRQVLGNHH